MYHSAELDTTDLSARLKYSLQDELQRELDEVKEHASSVAQQCLG